MKKLLKIKKSKRILTFLCAFVVLFSVFAFTASAFEYIPTMQFSNGEKLDYIIYLTDAPTGTSFKNRVIAYACITESEFNNPDSVETLLRINNNISIDFTYLSSLTNWSETSYNYENVYPGRLDFNSLNCIAYHNDIYSVPSNELRSALESSVNGKILGLQERCRSYYSLGEKSTTAYSNGYSEGAKDGYNTGYTQGAKDADYMEDTLITIFSSPYYILNEVFNFEIFGINVSSIIMFILSIILVGFVVKLII